MAINKKVVIALVVVLAVVAVAVFLIFKYTSSPRETAPQDFAGAVNSGNKNSEPESQVNIEGMEVETEGGSSGGGLIVCLDKCGDGICQKSDSACEGMNCVCPETPQECPQDCQ